jgi:hypothetical protein
VPRKAPTRRRTTKRRTTRKKTRKRPTARKKKTTRKRRRNPSKKRKPAARKRRRRTTKATTRRRRRRNPAKKRRTTRKRRRRSTARRNPVRRRRRKARRRRTVAKRRNPSKRRRRTVAKRRGRKRRRRNRGTIVGSVRKQLRDLMRPQTWLVPAAHGAIGFGIASAGPAYLARFTSQFGLRNHGLGGVALSGLSTALGAATLGYLASMLPKKGLIGKCCKGIVKNVAIGGMIATTIRLIHEIAPGSMISAYLPRIGGGMAPIESTAGMGYYGGSGYGSYPGQYPSYGPLGMIESPEQLVASESFARQINQLDGMGQPVPVEDIADWMQLSGMNDWVEFTPGSPYAAAAAQGDPGFPGAQGF